MDNLYASNGIEAKEYKNLTSLICCKRELCRISHSISRIARDWNSCFLNFDLLPVPIWIKNDTRPLLSVNISTMIDESPNLIECNTIALVFTNMTTKIHKIRHFAKNYWIKFGLFK